MQGSDMQFYMENMLWNHGLGTDMQFLKDAGLKMQCSKLKCMQKGYCAFKVDLCAKMKKQGSKYAMQYAKIRNKPKLLQFRGSDSKYEKTEGPSMQFDMVKYMQLNRLI